MTGPTRQDDIVVLTRENGWVSVDDLAARFGVTPQTIRRDLGELSDQGVISRVHGGAILASGVTNVGYDARRSMAQMEKEAIGALCASALPHACSLFINIGTTTEAVARSLGGHRDLMAITNNLNVANILAGHPSCEVIVAGGILRRADGGLVGEATIDFIRQFKVDYAVIGASAIDEDGALLDFDYREVRVAQAIIENARHVYLVADSSKFERSAPVRIASIAKTDAIFTDTRLVPKLEKFCRESGVAIRIVDDSGVDAASAG